MKIKDAFTDNGNLRPDGRMVHDVYLVQVKTPAESTFLDPPYPRSTQTKLTIDTQTITLIHTFDRMQRAFTLSPPD
jgi:hypothetical protein